MSDRAHPVEGLAAEDPLGSLYRRYARWLATRLGRSIGPEEAEDLVQETYLRLAFFRTAGEIRHPKALLLRIAGNLAVDAHRRTHRQRRAGSHVEEPREAREDPGQAESLLLKQIILSLPEPLREVFVLSRFGGLTYEQIGERLGLSVKTVEWRMSKALAHCAAQLRP